MFNEVRDCWCFNHECKSRTCASGKNDLCNKVECTLRDSGIDDLLDAIKQRKRENNSPIFFMCDLEQQGDMW